MIYIDFQGGAHGHYLEFVCNKFLANVACGDSPFSSTGSSHQRNYQGQIIFECGHFFRSGVLESIRNSKIVSIQLVPDDLLPIQSISLLRAGDLNIDPDFLHIDTYYKLDHCYAWLRENLIDSFFSTQIRDSYRAVKDPSWPDIETLGDYHQLPDWIKQECEQIHHLELMELSSDSPDCPRHILREFFKLSFKYPETSGFLQEQRKMQYHGSNQVFVWPFAAFYDTQYFLKTLIMLADFCEMSIQDHSSVKKLHLQFLEKQPYKHSKQNCDKIFYGVLAGDEFDLPSLDLLQESYLLAMLELHHDKNYNSDAWFADSHSIRKYFRG
jgi:hypothetical protein